MLGLKVLMTLADVLITDASKNFIHISFEPQAFGTLVRYLHCKKIIYFGCIPLG